MRRSGIHIPDQTVKIGVDFDNTIVCYGDLFNSVAVERSLIPANLPPTRVHVRDYLKAAGRNDAWTELQGYVYGVAIDRATPYPGVGDFFQSCRSSGIAISIISHKTRVPLRGPEIDLHAVAREWLRQHCVLAARSSDGGTEVFFEDTRRDKLARIATAGVTHFIDDLPSVLRDPAFPVGVQRILFDPQAQHSPLEGTIRVESWDEIGRLIPIGDAEMLQ